MSWCSGLMSQSKKIRALQHSIKRHWSQLVAMPVSSSSSSRSGSEGSRISLRVNKSDVSKPNVSPSCGPFPQKPIVTASSSLPHEDFLTKWFAASTKFLVDDDVVVVATENDAVASLSEEQQTTLFVDIDGQVPRERTVDVPNQAFGRRFGLS